MRASEFIIESQLINVFPDGVIVLSGHLKNDRIPDRKIQIGRVHTILKRAAQRNRKEIMAVPGQTSFVLRRHGLAVPVIKQETDVEGRYKYFVTTAMDNPNFKVSSQLVIDVKE